MIKFVDFDLSFLQASWNWLNDSDIKKLTNTSSFNKEEQLKWFNALPKKNNYFIRGVMFNNLHIGVVGLKNITKSDGEYWGYIGDKNFWGRGLGKKMIVYINEHAKSLNLSKVYLKVSVENLRAIRCYQKMGFILNQEKSNSIEYFMDLVFDR